MTAVKADHGKPDYTYFTKEFLDGVASVFSFGAKKYARDNWMQSINTESHDEFRQRALAALLRHAHAIANGEDIDPESGLPHAAHIGCNVQFLLTYDGRKE